MDYRRHPELIERLAAEYALGTLRGQARKRMQRLAREDAVVRRAIAEWEARLVPMASAVPEVEPPRRVWEAVRERVAASQAATGPAAPARTSFWDSLAFWRNLGLMTSGCAAALVAAMVLQKPQVLEIERVVEVPSKEMQQSYVATLADKGGNVVLLAYASRNSSELWIKHAGTQAITTQQAFELWGLPKDAGGKPVSLGLVPGTEKGTMKLAAAAEQTLKDFPALAISLEPAGGSTTGAPTGPVLYSGPCFKFW